MHDDQSETNELDQQYEMAAAEGGHPTKEQLLAIDLRVYDELAVYPADSIDWPLERKRVLFLQIAVKLGYPWGGVVYFTRQYFGPEIYRAPIALPALTPVDPFLPPPYDSRTTPAQWAREYDAASRAHRDSILKQIKEFHSYQIKKGTLKLFERERLDRGMGGQTKAAIADEERVNVWAALYFFSLFTEKRVSWADLATSYPGSRSSKNPVEAAKAKRKRADQIRKRVYALLQEIGLPVRK